MDQDCRALFSKHRHLSKAPLSSVAGKDSHGVSTAHRAPFQPVSTCRQKVILRCIRYSQVKIVPPASPLCDIALNHASVSLASYFIKKTEVNGEEIPHLTATKCPSLTAWSFPISLRSPISPISGFSR